MATINVWTGCAITEMAAIECCECGIVFYMPKDFQRRRIEDRGWFFCPSGHRQCYAKSEVQILKEKLAREREHAEALRESRDEARQAVERERRKVAAQKGLRTKMQRRIANGVCPCCNRTFQDLQKHMATKHPEFSEQSQDT